MIEEKVLKAIDDYSLLGDYDEITVALSGGADSVCLLYALNELKERLGVSISAAHFNHNIRGEEALRDERFVAELCKRLGVKLYCESGDVPLFARENKMSTELAAREMRYEFLERVSPGLIATAHTKSDNLETVIFNLTRGSALKGLCGIPVRRQRFIRPLIYCNRAEIEEYCKEKNLSFMLDSTNLCDDYSRNNIRHNVIKTLKEINPSVEESVMKTVKSLAEDSDFIEGIAKGEFEKRNLKECLLLSDFDKLHPAVAKRVILCFFNNSFSYNPDNFHINEIYRICIKGGKISLPDNFSAISTGDKLFFENNLSEKKKKVYNVKIIETGNYLFDNNKKIHNLLLKNTFDCDRIVGKLVVRTRIAGDEIKLKNKNCTKTLKKLYNEYKIPLCERESLPVISDEIGVVWICGIGVADRCAVDENSKRIFKVETQQKF